MSNVKINLQPLGKILEVPKGVDLIDILNEYGVEFPCAGKGTCGKCKVKLLKGDISISKRHQRALNLLELDSKWRLSCFSNCNSDVTLEIGQYKSIILADKSPFTFTPQKGYGVAVDLGTTTIVVQLLDLKSGEVIGVEKAMNPQAKFGSDIISRIQKAIDGKQSELTSLIRDKIESLIYTLISKADVKLEKIVLVGNTVMQHSFCGFNLVPLSMYPFKTSHLGLQQFTPKQLDWSLKVNDSVFFYPSIGAYVGSDILAGIISTKLYESKKYTVLVDLGTNGEIVVGNREKIVCASTAAGPAFEGTNISYGMQASTGAISTIEENSEHWKYHIIGNLEPKGICGSGLVDAIALLQKSKKIGIFGDLVSGEQKINLINKISLSQRDIREFQLAKAAIAAGIDLLIKQLSITKNDIDAVYIAGGFGNYLNLKHVVKTGMLEFKLSKIHQLGNTALIGAKMLLFKNPEFVNPILKKTSHISLESISEFQDVYIDKMMFL